MHTVPLSRVDRGHGRYQYVAVCSLFRRHGPSPLGRKVQAPPPLPAAALTVRATNSSISYTNACTPSSPRAQEAKLLSQSSAWRGSTFQLYLRIRFCKRQALFLLACAARACDPGMRIQARRSCFHARLLPAAALPRASVWGSPLTSERQRTQYRDIADAGHCSARASCARRSPLVIRLPTVHLLPACAAPTRQPSRTQMPRIESAAPCSLHCDRARAAARQPAAAGKRPPSPLLLLSTPALLSEQLLCARQRCSVVSTLAGPLAHAR